MKRKLKRPPHHAQHARHVPNASASSSSHATRDRAPEFGRGSTRTQQPHGTRRGPGPEENASASGHARTSARGHAHTSASSRPRRVDRDAAIAFAVAVAREAESSGEPADAVLRTWLRSARPGPAEAALVARAVFSWFRWRGFIDDEKPSVESITRALELAERFVRAPKSFDDAELIAGAVPAWLAEQMTLTPAFVRALQSEPGLWLRARPGCAAKLAATLPGARAGDVPALPEAVRFTGTQDLFRTPQFVAGRFEIQDIASQAVGVVSAPQPGETWWDACAGEGGKLLHLSDLMQNRGLIWASDRSAGRLAMLRKRARRAGVFNYRVAPWDGGTRLPTRTLFDGVLVDAPCSGVGTWGRNPHARWTTSPADVRDLALVQARLLDTVAPSVKPGGRLVYAVCTLTRDETEAVADAFTKLHAADFFPEPLTDPFARPGTLPDARGRLRWEPQTTGGNGMFVAAWRRNSR